MDSRVLVVEDVRDLASLICLYLGNEGLEARPVESAEAALELLPSFKPDLILLDLNLPGMDGFEFLNTIRGDTPRASGATANSHDSMESRSFPVPLVLIVSARDDDEDIIRGLGYGADEFVTKPFSPRVLVARVNALLRRDRLEAKTLRGEGLAPLAGPVSSHDAVSFGPFVLDLRSCILFRGSDRIRLSSREFDVLACLVRYGGVPRSPREIFDEVWQGQYGDLTAVAVYIQRLRRKMEVDIAHPRWIETVHGKGYRFAGGGPA